MTRKDLALFVCNGNSCRSQMAEGWLRQLAADRFEIASAGLEPRPAVHPLAVRVMAELGIDISAQRPKSVELFLGVDHLKWVFTVCDRAQRTCPRLWPHLGAETFCYLSFTDPAKAVGPESEQLVAFRQVRDEIRAALVEWLRCLPVGG